MKDANGREITIGDRVRRKNPGQFLPYVADPVPGEAVRQFASSTCVQVGIRVFLAEQLHGDFGKKVASRCRVDSCF